MLNRNAFEKNKNELIKMLFSYRNISQIESAIYHLQFISIDEKNPAQAYFECQSILEGMKKSLENKGQASIFSISPALVAYGLMPFVVDKILEKAAFYCCEANIEAGHGIKMSDYEKLILKQ